MIDIANASRKIKDSEVEACKAAGVTEIQEIRDGLVVDIDGDYTETPARIASNKNGIGVFGL